MPILVALMNKICFEAKMNNRKHFDSDEQMNNKQERPETGMEDILQQQQRSNHLNGQACASIIIIIITAVVRRSTRDCPYRWACRTASPHFFFSGNRGSPHPSAGAPPSSPLTRAAGRPCNRRSRPSARDRRPPAGASPLGRRARSSVFGHHASWCGAAGCHAGAERVPWRRE